MIGDMDSKRAVSRPKPPRRYGQANSGHGEKPNQPGKKRANLGKSPVRERTQNRQGRATRKSVPNPKVRRPVRSTNQNTVRTRQRSNSNLVSVGGLSFSVRALATLVIVGLAAIILIPTAIQWSEQKREYRAVSAEVVQAETKIDQLQGQLDNWNDREFVASQARSRLGYVDRGETQFSVVDAPEVEAAEVENLAPVGPQKPWTLKLQKEIQDADNPPAVRGAINAPTKPQETAGEDEG